MDVKVIEGQNTFDVVVQQYGTLENLFDMFALNTIDINTDLVSGQTLVVETEGKGNNDIKNTFITSAHITNNAELFTSTTVESKLWQNGDQVLFQNGNFYTFN